MTAIPWIDHYGCFYAAHGDDITSDSNGEDCYRFVKAVGRFAVFRRTPSISTTDLVGRMLLCTKTHFIKSFPEYLGITPDGRVYDDPSSEEAERLQRVKDYASDETGHNPGPEVFLWMAPEEAKIGGHEHVGKFTKAIAGVGPSVDQRTVYVDGGFDLFSSGHIEFLKRVYQAEGGEAYIVAGIHEDGVINHWKGLNYPIMNTFERGLCVLQCTYINAVIFGAPFSPSKPYLDSMPYGKVAAVYHGPTSFIPLTYDPYSAAMEMGIFRQIGEHAFSHVNAGEIVTRILKGRQAFEERQKKKGEKAFGEEAVRRREQMEAEAAELAEKRQVQ